MSDIKFDNTIPYPGNERKLTKYPYEALEVGDSFVVTAKNPSTAGNLAKAATARLLPKVFKHGRGPNKEFRIWRVA